MGCVGTKTEDEEIDFSKVNFSEDVDLQLIQDQIMALFKFKVLLLGAGETGKSTLLKQIKILHQQPISSQELDQTANSLHQNILDCMKALLKARQQLKLGQLDEEDQRTESLILSWDNQALMGESKQQNEGAVKRITPDLAEKIIRLFNSEAIKATYSRRNEYWILDSFGYYIENIRRISSPNFFPTEEDTVMARIRTTGIVVTDLQQPIPQPVPQLPDKLHFQIVDVGGQRNERKKWIHCFDDVKAVLFFENLAGYNQVLYEDSKKNRMHESLELFRNVTFNPTFSNIPFFLVLNKKDLFENMINQVDMKQTFPEYSGGNNYQSAINFVQEQFRRQANNKELQVLIVTARWKRDVRDAFDEVKKFLFDRNKDAIYAQVKELRAKQKEIILGKRRKR